ncbi:MAG: hypothetical protein JJT94_07580 [Bernardetiaceae bacterium]|nr:hypothetical protein [Bernardetiaceae bacterium]
MSSSPTNIINRQIIDIDLGVHKAWQQRLSRFCKDKLPKIIEQILDKEVPKDKYYRLDKIELDLGSIPIQNAEAELEMLIIKKLTDAIRLEIRRSKWIRPKQAQLDSLSHYFNYGYLPWWYSTKDKFEPEKVWVDLAQNSPRLLKQMLKQNKNRDNFYKRLEQTIPANSIQSFLQALTPDKGNYLKDLAHRIEQLDTQSFAIVSNWQTNFWAAALRATIKGEDSNQVVLKPLTADDLQERRLLHHLLQQDIATTELREALRKQVEKLNQNSPTASRLSDFQAWEAYIWDGKIPFSWSSNTQKALIVLWQSVNRHFKMQKHIERATSQPPALERLARLPLPIAKDIYRLFFNQKATQVERLLESMQKLTKLEEVFFRRAILIFCQGRNHDMQALLEFLLRQAAKSMRMSYEQLANRFLSDTSKRRFRKLRSELEQELQKAQKLRQTPDSDTQKILQKLAEKENLKQFLSTGIPDKNSLEYLQKFLIQDKKTLQEICKKVRRNPTSAQRLAQNMSDKLRLNFLKFYAASYFSRMASLFQFYGKLHFAISKNRLSQAEINKLHTLALVEFWKRPEQPNYGQWLAIFVQALLVPKINRQEKLLFAIRRLAYEEPSDMGDELMRRFERDTLWQTALRDAEILLRANTAIQRISLDALARDVVLMHRFLDFYFAKGNFPKSIAEIAPQAILDICIKNYPKENRHFWDLLTQTQINKAVELLHTDFLVKILNLFENQSLFVKKVIQSPKRDYEMLQAAFERMAAFYPSAVKFAKALAAKTGDKPTSDKFTPPLVPADLRAIIFAFLRDEEKNEPEIEWQEWFIRMLRGHEEEVLAFLQTEANYDTTRKHWIRYLSDATLTRWIYLCAPRYFMPLYDFSNAIAEAFEQCHWDGKSQQPELRYWKWDFLIQFVCDERKDKRDLSLMARDFLSYLALKIQRKPDDAFLTRVLAIIIEDADNQMKNQKFKQIATDIINPKQTEKTENNDNSLEYSDDFDFQSLELSYQRSKEAFESSAMELRKQQEKKLEGLIAQIKEVQRQIQDAFLQKNSNEREKEQLLQQQKEERTIFEKQITQLEEHLSLLSEQPETLNERRQIEAELMQMRNILSKAREQQAYELRKQDMQIEAHKENIKRFQQNLQSLQQTLNKRERAQEKERNQILRKQHMEFERIKQEYELRKNSAKDIADKKEKQPKGVVIEEPIYIQNAGLVIVHPYLTRLFNMLGYMKGKIFKDETLRSRAVHLLQFIADGRREQIGEHELMLNKILCGFSPLDVLERIEPITDEEAQAAESLIGGVIQNWKIIKNTSVENFRVSFLRREGRLIETEKEYSLRVEQRPYDMLVDKMPWSIAMIQLSFMQKMLRTEWR